MALKEVFAAFGFEIDSKKLDEADKKVDSLTKKLEGIAKSLLAGAAAVGFGAFIKSLADTGDALNDATNRLGISSDALQEFSHAAQQSGAGLENLTTGLLILNDKVGDALVNATGEGAKAFQKYGIAIRGAGGEVKSSDELFADVADRIGRAKTAQEQLTIAVDLFGKQGRVLLPLLKEGSAGLEAMRARARELGEGFSKEAVVAGDAFNDSLADLGRVVQTVRGRLAVLLLPLMRRVVDVVVAAGAKFLDLAKNSALFEGALASLAAVLTAKLIPGFLSLLRTLAPLAIPLAIIVAMTLVVDELITLFRGGKTVIGDFVDATFGLGTTEKIVRSLKQTFDDLFQGVRDGMELFRLFVKSGGGFHLDALSTDELLNLNKIAARASGRVGGDGQGFLPTLANGRGEAIQRAAAEVGQRSNPTVPAFLSRAFVSQPTAAAGTTITAPTNVTVNLSGSAGPEDELLIRRVMKDILDQRADDIRAALVPAVPR